MNFNTLNILSTFGYFTTAQLVELVKGSDREAPLFLVSMRPIRDAGLFTYESGTDPEVLVPCKVVETMYPLHQNYKIEVQATVPGYGKRAYYQCDFAQLVRVGQVQVIDQSAPVLPAPTGLAGLKLRIASMFSRLFGGNEDSRVNPTAG